MKYFIDGHWYSELQRRIKINDLCNDKGSTQQGL